MTTDSALFTDFYELTMAQGFWKNNMNHKAIFDMFFRRQPFGGGFSIFAGLETFLEALEGFRFSPEDIGYLETLGLFEKGFLDYLSHFRFSGNIWAMKEGSVVFPQEPLIRVEAGMIEAQLIEGMLLNTINFQSLVATKTARVWLASNRASIMEFGLRRAQGPDGAMSATRAAYIGGATSTSNTLAGRRFGIPVMGTMAHSWIMAFPSEREAFECYAKTYPDRSVFLLDTYDTLKSGLPNAIEAGRKLVAAGKNFGVRLDSGDMDYLSVEVRKALDAAGLKDATITVSNELDESIVRTLVAAGAPIDSWGVGTQMVTGGNDPAFTGVYKLAAHENSKGSLVPAMKFSDNPEKTTNPGVKQVWRLTDSEGKAIADVMGLVAPEGFTLAAGTDGSDAPLEHEKVEQGVGRSFWHPSVDYRHFHTAPEGLVIPLLEQRFKKGKVLGPHPDLKSIRSHVREELDRFDGSYLRLLNPHGYKVAITEKLKDLKLGLIQSYLGDM